MIIIMVPSMALRSAPAALAGAALLIVTSMVCAALSRTRRFLLVHIVDLWAMALMMIGMVSHVSAAAPQSAALGHHGSAQALPVALVLAVIVTAWAAARVAIALRAAVGAADVVSAALTATGLVVMTLVGH
jgi:hypothetical protein